MRRIVTSGLVLWMAVLACTYQYQGPYQGGAQQGGAGSPAVDPLVQQAAEARARHQRDAIRTIAETYDSVLDTNRDADGLLKGKHYEAATLRFRRAQSIADQTLAWFADARNRLGRGPDVQYPTQHDGKLDEATLVANLRAARDHAAKKGTSAWDKAIAALAKELHARTPAQRAVLVRLGRPEVHKSKIVTCWTYRTAAADETYCWNKRGKLARHDVNPRHPPVQVARANPPPDSSEGAPPPPADSSDDSQQPAAPPEPSGDTPSNDTPSNDTASSDTASSGGDSSGGDSSGDTSSNDTASASTPHSCNFDSDCKGGFKCVDSVCGKCNFDSDCPGGSCHDGMCGAAGGGCNFDSDCGNLKCVDSKCGKCNFDSDCPGGKCSDNLCTNVGGHCNFDSDCPPNNSGHCDDGKCE